MCWRPLTERWMSQQMFAWLFLVTSFLLLKFVHSSSKALGRFWLWTTSLFPNNYTLFPLTPSYSSHSGSFPSTLPPFMGSIKWQLRYTGLRCVPNHSCLSLSLSSSFHGESSQLPSLICSFRSQSCLGCPYGLQHHGLQYNHTKGLQCIFSDW